MVVNFIVDFLDNYRVFILRFTSYGWHVIFAAFFAIGFISFIPFLFKYLRR